VVHGEVTTPRLLRAASAALLLATLALPGCKRSEPAESQPPAGAPTKQELPVEQTPVSSLYEEKPGVLYERAVRTPTVSFRPTPTRTPPPYVP